MPVDRPGPGGRTGRRRVPLSSPVISPLWSRVDLAYFERMCAARAVDCVQVDVTRCGGISELLRIAAVAEAHGLEVSGHCAPGLHVAPLAAVPNLRHLEWFHDHVRIESTLFDGLPDPSGGQVTPSDDAAGHGLSWIPAAASSYRVA